AHILLHRDLTQLPSWSESFFVTVVHEMGHALGLQHTLTSSVMSTAWTSASSKARPLDDDDRAGVSVLYPADGYAATVGSISGRVTLGGNGVSMASVVAISDSSPAVSTLTNPDGTYQLDGLAQGIYYLYVHPLPPALSGESNPANIFAPTLVDSPKVSFPANIGFAAQFAPGTRDVNQAQILSVFAGKVKQNVNFTVSARTQSIHSIRTYGYAPGSSVPVPSPPVNSALTLLADGAGLLQNNNNATTPGLNVGVFGSFAYIPRSTVRLYQAPYIAMDLYLSNNINSLPPGRKHLLFSTNSELYLLPSAFNLVTFGAPSISSVNPGVDNAGNRIVTISGMNLFADTRVLFDGLDATPTPDSPLLDGSLVVYPPAASPGYTAGVVALGADGQSSLYIQSPPSYTYDSGTLPALSVSPYSLSPGDNVIDITGANTNFIDCQTIVGFGSSDALVKNVTVLSPTHLTATVTVSQNAAASINSLSVTTGLQVISSALGFQIGPASSQAAHHR
ncbi:MAG: matrixin family metalloprotease, partial [Acidobacteriota bacterium]|nr:matrixin family metalloprotease [Acidobacteriota bacterium]